MTEAEVNELKGNLKSVLELEERVKAAEEAGKGAAELKAQIAQISAKNAELVDTMQKRQDEFEAQMQAKGAPGSAAYKTAGERFTSDEAIKSAAQGGIGALKNAAGVVVPRSSFKAVTLTGNATPPEYVGEIIRQQDRRLTMRDLLPVGRTSQNAINYIRVLTRPAGAATVAAGAAKPESNLAVEDVNQTLSKIATYIAATEEQLSDFDQLRSLIDAELEYAVTKEEDAQILAALVAGATAYAPVTYGSTVTAAQRLDHLRGMIAQLQVADYAPSGIVLNPLDWFKLETSKDSNNAYIFGRPQDSVGPRLWGLPVSATNQMTADSALVGDFRIGAQIFDGQLMGQYGTHIRVGQPNAMFLSNQYAILAECRFALALKRPGAFVTGDLTPA